MKARLLIVIVCLMFVACGGKGVSQTTNPDTPSISISKLTAGSVTVTIPLSVFGDSTSDLTGAAVNIIKNSVLVTEGLNVEEYYHETSEAVMFAVGSLEEGDILEIRILLADGSRYVFSGAVSSSEERELFSLDTTGDADGYDALADRDIAAAGSVYCDAVDEGSSNSATAFGCFLSTLVGLPETTEADTLLAALDEDSIDVETDILEGIFDNIASVSSETHPGFDDFNYRDYADLPLNSIIEPSRSLYQNGYNLAGVLYNLVNTGTTAEELQDDIVALRTDFEYMESMLDIVLADDSFAYTIPQDLFATDNDVVVSYNDARLFMSGIKSTIVALNVIDAYDFGVNIEDIMTDDDINQMILVDDLNGTGALVDGVTVDTVPFLTMDDASLITDSEDRFVEAMEYLSDGMQALLQGETSEMLENTFDTESAEDYYDLTQGIADDLLRSINTDSLVVLSVVSDYSDATVSINLKEFFTNPPSAADVTGSDPFVYEDFKCKIVESYFRDLLDGIVEF